MFDLSAVFDAIDHDILIICLSTWYGISGRAFKIGNCFSDKLPTSCGVSQDYFWAIAFHFLYSAIKLCYKTSQLGSWHLCRWQKLHFLATHETCRSISQLSDFLHNVSFWMKNSKLKLNADKTEFLIIDTQTQHRKLDGFLAGVVLVVFLARCQFLIHCIGSLCTTDISRLREILDQKRRQLQCQPVVV